MSESLMGLEFKNFEEIPGFEEKLSFFLNSLDEELETWRDYEERNGNRVIPHPIGGYACLDGDKIVALSYYNLPRKNSLTHYIHKLFPPKIGESGAVTKKDYQRRGIAWHLNKLKNALMLEKGYKRIWYTIYADNMASMNWVKKSDRKPFKKEGNKLYYARDLDEDTN